MPPETNLTTVIVERSILAPVPELEDCRVLAELVTCFDFHNVHFVESFLSEQRNRMICRFEAPDAESVRQAFRGAGLSIDRVWTAKVAKRHRDS